jgi:hypothetical protein
MNNRLLSTGNLASHRGVHDGFLGGFGAGDFGGDSAAVENDDPVAEGQEFGELARDQQDRQTGGSQFVE